MLQSSSVTTLNYAASRSLLAGHLINAVWSRHAATKPANLEFIPLCPHPGHTACAHRRYSNDPDLMYIDRCPGEIAEVLRQYSDKIEPLSLDEAYLDVTDSELHQGSATLIAKSIKQEVKARTQLTASAGVSYNKFLAKIASDMDKPDGLYVIKPEQGAAFIEKLAIGKFHGIGKATEAKMQALDIHTGKQLKQWSREKLLSHFGKAGSYYYDIAQGIDNRPVVSSRIRKSLGTETTFEHDLSDKQEMLVVLSELADKVVQSMQRRELHAKTVTIKVKYADFSQVTRSQTMEEAFNDKHTISPILPLLLDKTEAGEKKVRLLGVTTSNFIGEDETENQAQIELI